MNTSCLVKDVSIIIPVYNSSFWIQDCLDSALNQTFSGTIELSIFNDGSNDNTVDLIDNWIEFKLNKPNYSIVVGGRNNLKPRGVGYAKNQAIAQSNGNYLCFLDSDDLMYPQRLERLISEASYRDICHNYLFGSKFDRLPESSTHRFTQWANSLHANQLYHQIYTSHGPTLITPTWFCSRDLFDRLKGFDETGQGVPEDLIFFFRHLEAGGKLFLVKDVLVTYRYHLFQTTFSVDKETIWKIRLKEFEKKVLNKWLKITIWSAGKEGRKFYRSLSQVNKDKVVAFCDVDIKKINKGCYIYEESKEKVKPKVPIVHYSKAEAPFVICVKLGLTNGQFENNLKSLGLKEGVDYFHFG